MTLTLDLVGRFERHLAEAVESLLTHSLRVPGNPEGYALFRAGPVLATLSANPRAMWATQTYGLTGQRADVVRRVVEFYRRLADATALGCRMVFGGADFENESRTNQAACGLTVAYTVALWAQRPDAMRPGR